MTTSKAFGLVLRHARKKLDISQEELGFRCHLDRTFISMLERGVRQPSLETIFELSRNLGLRPSEFLKKTERILKI